MSGPISITGISKFELKKRLQRCKDFIIDKSEEAHDKKHEDNEDYTYWSAREEATDEILENFMKIFE